MRLVQRRAHNNTETWETPIKGITRRVMLLAAFVAVAGIAACKHKGEGGPSSVVISSSRVKLQPLPRHAVNHIAS